MSSSLHHFRGCPDDDGNDGDDGDDGDGDGDDSKIPVQLASLGDITFPIDAFVFESVVFFIKPLIINDTIDIHTTLS